MKISPLDDLTQLEALLKLCALPTADLHTSAEARYFGCFADGALIAAIGIEIYQESALLRSLSVHPENRSQGIGDKLVHFAEAHCQARGVTEMYLLTTTAEAYFLKFGYQLQKRRKAPTAIKLTSQFSGICPSSSSFMVKRIPVA